MGKEPSMEKKKKKTKPIENEENLVNGLEDFTGPDEPGGPAAAQIYPCLLYTSRCV